MRTLAQKSKAVQQTTAAKSTVPGQAHFGQSRDVNSILHLQRTIGNQAVQRMLKSNAEELEPGSTTSASTPLAHGVRAFTRGHDVIFGPDEYGPDTEAGRAPASLVQRQETRPAAGRLPLATPSGPLPGQGLPPPYHVPLPVYTEADRHRMLLLLEERAAENGRRLDRLVGEFAEAWVRVMEPEVAAVLSPRWEGSSTPRPEN